MSLTTAAKIVPSNTIFFMCDVQERFRSLIQYFPSVIHVANQMSRVGAIMNIPVVVTEQYPKAFGPTVDEIHKGDHLAVFAKDKFSMIDDNVREYIASLQREKVQARTTAVLFGIEAHVCVLQTALDLVERGYQVHVIADGTSSQRVSDRTIAFERMKQSGVYLTTSESLIFQLLGSSKHPNFKQISSELLKDARPETGISSSL
eukprot:TRINITY_DN3534_c0_g1_i1.p1 TRINITY_DN3534_c0_g1~~TRINITY_DN3534_c0_g1_i1.p1  ORF type:complete len:215 (+),score=75.40 TRINITY_DN3534_c0_g1_i1:36-647(+)